VIYRAATDDTNQLRYIAGEDAEALLASRKTDGDATFLQKHPEPVRALRKTLRRRGLKAGHRATPSVAIIASGSHAHAVLAISKVERGLRRRKLAVICRRFSDLGERHSQLCVFVALILSKKGISFGVLRPRSNVRSVK
jgi:hypothetical protein